MTKPFRLEDFGHPLRQIKYLKPEVRLHIFEKVGDRFNTALERLALGESMVPGCLDTRTLECLRKFVEGDSLTDFEMAFSIAVPTEQEMLFRLAQDTDAANLVSAAIAKARILLPNRGRTLTEYPAYFVPNHAKSCFLLGEFRDAIRVAMQSPQMASDTVGESWSKAYVLGIISRSYEMLGEFGDAADWRKQQIKEVETRGRKDVIVEEPYEALARIYLKAGLFAEAAVPYQQARKLMGGWYEKMEFDERILTAVLYALGRDREGCMEVVKGVIKEYLSERKLRALEPALDKNGLLMTLEENDFLDDLAKIYEEIDRIYEEMGSPRLYSGRKTGFGTAGFVGKAIEEIAEKSLKRGNRKQAIEMRLKATRIYIQEPLIDEAVACLKRIGQAEPSLIQALVQKSREKGKLEDLAETLQREGFYEEAAKIYDDLGQTPTKSKSGPTQRPKESKPSAREADSTKSACPNCDSEVKANWLECPQCGASLKDTVCQNCGELLQPHWERCPACRMTVERTS